LSKYYYSRIQNKTLTPGQATVRYILNKDLGKISEDQRAMLLESMKTLCEGLDIIQIEEIEVSEEEFNQRTVNPFLNHTLGQDDGLRRVKREFSFISKCALHQACARNTGDSRYCLWDVQNLAGGNKATHIRSTKWACVICCPEGLQPNGLCGCDDIVDEETFRSCQLED